MSSGDIFVRRVSSSSLAPAYLCERAAPGHGRPRTRSLGVPSSRARRRPREYWSNASPVSAN